MTKERESARPVSELDRATAQRIEALMSSEPSQLTEGDHAFLTARRDYLTADQRKDFGITGKVAKVDEDAGGDKYDAMDKDALKKEAKKRELAVSGTNAELRARLRESDTASQ